MLSVRLSRAVSRISAEKISTRQGRDLLLPKSLEKLYLKGKDWQDLPSLLQIGVSLKNIYLLSEAGLLEIGNGGFTIPLQARRYMKEQFPSSCGEGALGALLSTRRKSIIWIGVPYNNINYLRHSTAVGFAYTVDIALLLNGVKFVGVLPYGSPDPTGDSDLRQVLGATYYSSIRLGILGGDHRTTWSFLRSLKSVLRDSLITYIHIDAHHDMYDGSDRDTEPNNANFVTRLLQDGDIERAVIVGCRDKPSDSLKLWLQRGSAYICHDVAETLLHIQGVDQQSHVHLSIDVDILDPSLFPDVACPIPGGWSWETLVCFVSELTRKVQIRSFSIGEVTGGGYSTARAAAHIMQLIADSREVNA